MKVVFVIRRERHNRFDEYGSPECQSIAICNGEKEAVIKIQKFLESDLESESDNERTYRIEKHYVQDTY
jgi:hypothetical protein